MTSVPVRARSVITLMLALVAQPLTAQSDSGRALFTYRDAILAGTAAAATYLIRPLDDHYAQRLQDSSTQANRKLQWISGFVTKTVAPGTVIIGTTMYATGRLTKNDRLARLGLYGTEALLVGELTAGAMKGVFGRQRPYVRPRNSDSYALFRGFGRKDQFRSFPSGHTVAAFAAAAAVTSETSGWWPDSRWIIGPLMYGGAAVAGASRMYDNRHWASDVIAGAAIGTFAGLKVVRYHDIHPGRGFDRWLLSGALVPAANGGRAIQWSIMPDLSPRPNTVQNATR